MAINAIQGLMGAGKTYVAANRFMPQFLRETKRHIYTNLPLNLDSFLRMAAPGNPARQLEYRDRIHFLEDKDLEVPEDCWEITQEKHGTVTRKTRNQLSEFWYFTEPNAVVFLDEVADIYSADKYQKRPATLASYINHHRHYKDDLFFFCQDRDDIDVKIRRKIQYVWIIRNSTKENMCEHWSLKGLKWPVQFFICKCYLGTNVLKLDARQMATIPTEDGFWQFPSKKGFASYRSFSASKSLPGKKVASEDDTSSDCDPRLWPKIRRWVDSFGMLGAMACGAIVGLYMAYRFIWGMLNVDSEAIAAMGLIQTAEAKANPGMEQGVIPGEVFPTKSPSGVVAVSSSPGNNPLPGQTNYQANFAPMPTNQVNEVERLVLVSNGRFVTMKGKNRKVYAKGSKVGSNVVGRVFLDGVHWERGGGERFEVLFPGK